ncbi:helix-turn-helix domain-containing protein [Streptomyces iranensis]|uniref:helix-turn-helix domain-containing protein n=1 Tax=Streptomyces iranensis TaxID=576784 RepID=UPI0039B73DC1
MPGVRRARAARTRRGYSSISARSWRRTSAYPKRSSTQRLLRAGGLSAGQVATRCGFGSPGSLSTAFPRHTGVRPSAYRNR